LDFTSSLIKDNRSSAMSVTEQVAAYAHLPEVEHFGFVSQVSYTNIAAQFARRQ
jgi:hypothetical protein